ncbi:MAG: mucin desulfatase [Clostridia bacterium]|jgi:Ser/Thr protein kinase RdoA (MazF antagonist)|nr:mucin desulfatase [Clostridia bacterium]
MNETEKFNLELIVSEFEIEGRFIKGEPYGDGHINDTYIIYIAMENYSVKPYILQRINSYVFKNPEQVMSNIERVTGYLRDVITDLGKNPLREVLNVIPTKHHMSFFKDEADNYWRVYVFIEGARTYNIAKSTDDLYHAGKAFGNFQCMLAEYPVSSLFETIPNFHHTVKRYAAFIDALEKDSCKRAAEVKREIDFVISHKKDTEVLLKLLDAGQLPTRVVHNDTKLNNVMIDDVTREGICVIDLDTVMPGLSLYDFGDAIRFAANSGDEDEPDLSKIWMDLDSFEAYTKGYLETALQALTDKEVEMLPMAAKVMTLECGIRFLTDYLSGDVYFKTSRTHQNLDRARTQFKLVSDMEEKWDEMSEIVKKYSAQ